MIIGEYFLRDGLNTIESPKVFHCAPVSPTIGRAFGTHCVVCLSSVCRMSVCDVLYCGKTVGLRPSEKLSEGVNRKPGTKS